MDTESQLDRHKFLCSITEGDCIQYYVVCCKVARRHDFHHQEMINV